MSLLQSTLLSVKMLMRNKQRAFTMMIGISISTMLLIGIFSYVDNSQKEIINSSIEDVNIDMAIYLPMDDSMVFINQSSIVDSLQAHLQDFGDLYSDSYFVQGISEAAPWNHVVSAINYGLTSISDFTTFDIISLITPINASTQKSGKIIELNIKWGSDELVYNWDGDNNITVTDTANITLPSGEGLHNLSVYVQQIAGNWVSSYYEFITDDIIPSVILESPVNETTQKSGVNIDLTVNGGDGYLIYNWDYNSNTTVIDLTYLYIPLVDGLHNLSLYVRDFANNWVTNYYEFTVNGTVLSLILESPTNMTTHQSGITIDFTVIGSDGNFIYNWDDLSNTTVINSTNLTLLPGDGLHTLNVYLQDGSSNWLTKYYEFTTDDTAPILNLDSPTNGTVQQAGTSIDFNVSSSDGYLHYKWNENSFTTVIDTTNLTLPIINGLHNLTVYVQDNSGNFNLKNYQFTTEGGTDPIIGFENGYFIGQPVIVLGVPNEYFSNFPGLFRTENNELDNSSIYISNALKDVTALNTGNHLNLSVMRLNEPYISLDDYSYLSNQTFEISGIIDIDSINYRNELSSFIAQSDEKKFESNSELVVFMNNDLFNQFIIYSNISGLVDSNVIQVNLNKNFLEFDIQMASAQIDQFINYVKLDDRFLKTTITSQLLDQIERDSGQINQFRLTIIYLSIPGIIIGFYLTRYATDLILKERKREISALRAGSISQSQIRNYLVVENLITALIGIIVGLFAGFSLSVLIINSGQINDFNIYLSTETILLVVGIGLLLVLLSGINISHTAMKKSIITGLQEMPDTNKTPRWRKYKFDYILLIISGSIILSELYLDIEPITGFGTAIFDLLVPLTAWTGLSLFMVRFFQKIISKTEHLISFILKILFGEYGTIISKNIVRKSDRIGQLSVILILILSFGLVIGNISATYNNSIVNDTEFAIGSDLRILMPSNNQLDYNTTEFQRYIEFTFPEIDLTPVFVSNSPYYIGDFNEIYLIGIDPESFFEVAFFQENFIQNLEIKELIDQIKYDPTNNKSKIVLSKSVGSPYAEDDESRLGKGSSKMKIAQKGSAPAPVKGEDLAFYEVGDDATIFSINSQGLELFYTSIIDIGLYFPALHDLLELPISDINYAFTDYRSLTESVNNGIIYNNGTESVYNSTIFENGNATLFLGKTNYENITLLVDNINADYNANFPTTTSITLTTVENYQQTGKSMQLLLGNFALLEIIVVFLSSIFVIMIFVNSTILSKRELLGTLNALGASNKKLSYLVSSELLVTSIFVIPFSYFLGTIVSFTYLGFISELFTLPISLSESIDYHLILYLILLFSLGIMTILIFLKIYKMDTFDLMREI